LMDSYFCSSIYSGLVFVSFDTPFFRKPFKTSLTLEYRAQYYFLEATCVSRVVATPGIWYGVHDMHLGSAQFTQLNIPYYALYVGKSKIMYRVSYAYV